MQRYNLHGVVSDLVYRIPALPTQGTGPDVVMDVSAEEPEALFCRALDLPFTDKGIQAYRLKRSTSTSGQSVVCRHTRALVLVVVEYVLL